MAPINVFLHDRTWVLPSSNLLEVRVIQDLARRTQIHSCDHVTWDGIQSNFASYSALYNTIRCRKPAIPWFDCTWNIFTIPKCSFISWLALKDRLLTRDKMILWQMHTDPHCLFCSNLESTQHLFSDCPFFDLIRRACPIKFCSNWATCQDGQIFAASIDRKLRLIGSLYLTVAVYLTWKERNF